MRICQVRVRYVRRGEIISLGQVGSGKNMLGQVTSGFVWLGHVMSGYVRLDHVRSI
jgi:hypothetical protein